MCLNPKPCISHSPIPYDLTGFTVALVSSVQFSSVAQSCLLFATPWTAARQASLSVTNSEFTQTHVHWVSDAIQPSHPIRPLLLLPSIFPSIRVFSSVYIPHQYTDSKPRSNFGPSSSSFFLFFPFPISGHFLRSVCFCLHLAPGPFFPM